MNYTIELTNNWKIIDFDKLRVNIDYDDDARDWSDYSCWEIFLDIREHRRYNFEHDFNINWDILDEDWSDYKEGDEIDYGYERYKEELAKYNKILEDYYVFGLDFYEHSGMWFSLVQKRMNIGYYEFDRTRDVWIIAVKKDFVEDEQDAIKQAEIELENYNNRCNGAIYQYRIEEKEDYYSKDSKKHIIHWDFYDGCCGFIDFDWVKQDAMENIKYYLNSNWVEFDDIKLIEN